MRNIGICDIIFQIRYVIESYGYRGDLKTLMNTFFIWYSVPLVLLSLFFVAYRINRVNLITGIILSCSIVSFTGIFFIQAYYSDSRVLRTVAVIPLILVVLMLTFGVYIFIAFLVLNTRSILKREKRDLKHCLTLGLAVGLLLIVFVPRFIDLTAFPQVVVYLSYSAYGLIIYYLLHLTQFIISMILCNLSRVRKDQQYIIVLGCWITNGKVTPILARRVDRAIKFYDKQKKVCEPPKLLLSGGKGSDETCPEAEAMRDYALAKGIPDEHILLESESVSTFENMKLSKKIMDGESGGKPYNCIYATNNYHVFRAGILARKAGLKINGVGAKTAFYYLPNAVLREYIAYLYIHIKWNIVFGIFSLIFGSLVLPL